MSPFVALLIAISMSVCGELMLKHGMNNVGTLDLTGWHAIGQLFRTFTNPFVLAGLVVIFGGSIFWLSVLSKAELSWAYPMLSLSYVAGVFLSAEVLGANRAIFVKDEDGLFTDDPKKNPKAEKIPRISAKELLKMDLPDLVVERVVIEYLARARFCTELQIINGLERGMLTRALEGEDVGTLITRD